MVLRRCTSLNLRATLFPLYIAYLGLSPAFLGFIVSLSAVIQVFFRLPAGMAVDRWGEKAVLLFSIVCMILSGPLYLSRYVHWIITAQLFIGFSRALYWPPSESYVSKGFGFTLERRLGFFNLAVGTGLILGPLLAGFLLGRFYLCLV